MDPGLSNASNTAASWLDTAKTFVTTQGLAFGIKLLGAIALWVIGRWLIGLVLKLIRRGMGAKTVDPTLVHYLTSALNVMLNVILVVAMLGFFGVETTSFAAVLAAAGVAIGMAWSGLLANFAAGVFLLILKPFKVGDLISAGGVTGTVKELGLFATTISTVDGITTYVGNNKIFSDNIQNLQQSPQRRVDLVAQLAHTVDVADAQRRLVERVTTIPGVLASPAPSIEILQFTERGPLLAVRPYSSSEDYWNVFFATNRVINETFGQAGYPVPELRTRVINSSDRPSG